MHLLRSIDKSKKQVSIILFILSIIYLILYLKPSLTDFDENYTLTLIRHNFHGIIYYDSLDVHPPLYYFMLKIFLFITTSWTTYFPFKVLFSRLFSVLISVITFIYLRRITYILNIGHNIYIQWAMFIMLPNVLGAKYSLQQLVNIRMYALAALFITLAFYFLLKFDINGSNIEIIFATVCIICAAYTHYYAMMFGSLLILFDFIGCFIHREYIKTFKISLSGIVVITSFLPWLPIFIKQIKRPTTYWMDNKMEIEEIIMFLIIFLIFIYPFITFIRHVNSLENKKGLINLLLIISMIFLFTLIYSMLKSPMFQYRYMYPVMLIYEFLSINILFTYRQLFIRYLLIILIMFTSAMLLSSFFQIKWDIYSYDSIKTYNNWMETSKIIYIKTKVPKSDLNDSSYIPLFHNKFVVLHNSVNAFKDNTTIYSYQNLFHNTIKKIKLQK